MTKWAVNWPRAMSSFSCVMYSVATVSRWLCSIIVLSFFYFRTKLGLRSRLFQAGEGQARLDTRYPLLRVRCWNLPGI